ncbi:MAG: hypothetical protein IPL22_02305 [Bacteroidetes bacterium]|nr:hypothetical protein [Bacteroidota bacterium]
MVSNTLKHAFSENQKGELRVTFRKMPDDLLRLTIADTGKGMPEGFDFEEADSLGMQLINALSNQLDAKLTLINEGGCTFILDFKPVH